MRGEVVRVEVWRSALVGEVVLGGEGWGWGDREALVVEG